MKKSRLAWILGLVAAGALLLGACGSDSGGSNGVSDELRQQGINDMVSTGMDQEAAECMIEAFGSDITDMVDNEDFQPSAEQTETVFEITTDCGGFEDILDATNGGGGERFSEVGSAVEG